MWQGNGIDMRAVTISLALMILGSTHLRAQQKKPVLLKEPTVVQGNSFPRGTHLEFFGTGELHSAILGSSATIQGIVLSSSTEISFYRGAGINSIQLRASQKLDGVY